MAIFIGAMRKQVLGGSMPVMIARSTKAVPGFVDHGLVGVIAVWVAKSCLRMSLAANYQNPQAIKERYAGWNHLNI